MQRAAIAIEGMSCRHCVNAVRQALEKLDGVTIEEVSIGSATVAYDPEITPMERITQTVREAGYEATAGAGR